MIILKYGLYRGKQQSTFSLAGVKVVLLSNKTRREIKRKISPYVEATIFIIFLPAACFNSSTRSAALSGLSKSFSAI